MRRPLLRAIFGLALFTFCALLVACGGGSTTGGGLPTTAPTSSTTPAVAPTAQATTASASTTAATTVSLGGVSNGTTNLITSGSAVVPQVNIASSATITLTATAPNGVAVPSARNERGRNLLGVANTPVAYFALTMNNTVTITQSPGFTVVLPSNVSVAAGNAYLVVSSSAIPNGWQEVAGPIAAANTMTFQPTAVNPSPFTLTGGVTYTFAIVTTGSVTIQPAIASIAISVSGDIPVGVSGSIPVTIVAKDVNGNTITGTYSNPITLTDTDASAQTSVSATSIPDTTTAATITLAYKGGAMSAPAVISASAAGVPVASVTSASFAPDAKWPTGASTTTFAYQVTTQHGAVNASPSPASTGSATLTETYSTGASFAGVNNLVNLHRAYSNQINVGLTTEDDYYQWSASAPYSLGLVGSVFASIPLTETCTNPYSPIFVAGATSWDEYKGTGPCTQTSGSVASGYTSIGTYNADGSYTDTSLLYPPGSTVSDETDITTVNADGSAFESYNNATGSSVTVIYTPAPGASTIPEYVATYPGALPSPLTPGPANTTVPNWYIQAGIPNGVPASPLQTATIAITSNATLPVACAVPTSLLGGNPSITKMTSPFASLDPTYAYFTETENIYILDGVGVVCAVEPLVLHFPGSGTIPASQTTNTVTYYATQSTLTAALKKRGFAQAMQTQNAMLMDAVSADRMEYIRSIRSAAMLRRARAIRH